MGGKDYPVRLNGKFDGKREEQIMGSQPRKEGNTSTDGAKS